MKLVNLSHVSGEHFPSGRWTRILAGGNSEVQPERFVVGYTVLYPGGGIPPHRHPNEEVYVILSGQARLRIDAEEMELTGVAAAYIPPDVEHTLVNITNHDVTLMFIYAPTGVVDHWEQERVGQLTMKPGMTAGDE